MNNNNKRISDIIISKDQPRYNDLWLDVSEGEKNAVLKYKGNPLVGGGSGSGGGSTGSSKPVNMFGIVENMTEEEIAIFQQNNPNMEFNFARKIRKEDIFASMFLYESTDDVFAGWYISEYNDGPSYRNQSDGKFVKVVLNTVNVPFYSPDAEARLVQLDSAPNLMGLSSDWLYGVTTLQQG